MQTLNQLSIRIFDLMIKVFKISMELIFQFLVSILNFCPTIYQNAEDIKVQPTYSNLLQSRKIKYHKAKKSQKLNSGKFSHLINQINPKLKKLLTYQVETEIEPSIFETLDLNREIIDKAKRKIKKASQIKKVKETKINLDQKEIELMNLEEQLRLIREKKQIK